MARVKAASNSKGVGGTMPMYTPPPVVTKPIPVKNRASAQRQQGAPARLAAQRVHGSSVAAKPDRTPHRTSPGRDTLGRILPGAGAQVAGQPAMPMPMPPPARTAMPPVNGPSMPLTGLTSLDSIPSNARR